MDVAASERLSLSERLSTISLRFSTLVCTREEKKVIFIDEIPWLDTPRSGFLSALEYFWNSFASARKDVLLIICGSATSWIINKVLKNHGGLHNRVTYRIHLQPFTLYECKQYAKYLGMRASHYDLIEYYMILGGVAFYWSRFDKGLSVAQNIDNMIFSETGFLHNEFNELYDSLFNEPESYLKIIHALGTIRIGMTRDELVKEGGFSSNGKLTRMLEDLTECGFIKRIPSYGGAHSTNQASHGHSRCCHPMLFMESQRGCTLFWYSNRYGTRQKRQHHQYLRDEVFQRRIHHNERLCDGTQQ